MKGMSTKPGGQIDAGWPEEAHVRESFGVVKALTRQSGRTVVVVVVG